MVSQNILIAGAVTTDWLTFPKPGDHDLSIHPYRNRTMNYVVRRGGVDMLTQLLSQALEDEGHKVSGLRQQQPQESPSSGGVDSIFDLIPTGPESKDGWTYKVERGRRIAQKVSWHSPENVPPAPEVLLLVDSSNVFEDIEPAISLLQNTRPQYLLYKMTRPLGVGKLWDKVRLGPMHDDSGPDPTRLIVVINADDLRAEGIELHRHLSWEKAAEDFVHQLGSSGHLVTLVTCAHLIVRFDCDGVIHHRGGDRSNRPVLYFDPKCAEGEFVESHLGPMIGLTTAFTAGLVMGLVNHPDKIENGIQCGIRCGFAAARRLAQKGFCAKTNDPKPDYPFEEIIHSPRPDWELASVELPSEKILEGSPWSILEVAMGDPTATARRIVKLSPGTALAGVPTARFGELITADRQEIESFRAITNILNEYFRTPQTKPCCIGVFGPQGAGKAFVATQVGKRGAGRRPVVILEYNLSQFGDIDTLSAAFQTIRDHTLAGELPMVLFESFDAAFRMKLGWLRYFLTPLQRGKFLDHGKEHPLGSAVFFFITSSYSTFEQFVESVNSPVDYPERDAFYAAKGPDFISCLRGYINIIGPDRAHLNQDHMYPIRRALMLRALLEKRESQLKFGERIIIDDAVLNALLSIPKYRHGARSLEMILATSTISGRGEFQRAALPAESQLDLHVDAEEFLNIVRYPRLPEILREKIAAALNFDFSNCAKSVAADHKMLGHNPETKSWDNMSDDEQESARSQADDIPHKLRMVNCYMAKLVTDSQHDFNFTEAELDLLAEREHERWIVQCLQKGESQDLRPWRDLEQERKNFGCAKIKCIPQVLRREGYGIYRPGNGDKQNNPETVSGNSRAYKVSDCLCPKKQLK